MTCLGRSLRRSLAGTAVLAAVVSAALAVVVASGLAAPAAATRRHRLHAVTPPLPSSLAVDEQEYSVTPSQDVVAAGRVTFHAYDRGQDAHNMTVIGPGGKVLGVVNMQPGTSGSVALNLKPGTYQLVCTLFAGTPQSHEALGMHALLTVR